MFKYFTVIFILISVNAISAQCWHLVWSDEFDGNALDTTKWTPQVGAGGWGNNELQFYSNRSENIQINNGTLKIVAQKEKYKGSDFTSARLHSIGKGDWTYGRFEARIKLPIAKGMWPAFWLLPTENYYGSHPKSGEIDIMELLPLYPHRVYGSIHTANAIENGIASTNGTFNLEQGTFNDDFHTFTLDWSPDTLRWYVDHQLYSTKSSADFNGSPWRFDRNFYIILNLAIGGAWGGNPDKTSNLPQQMEIDYVRVFKQNNQLEIQGLQMLEPHTEGVSYELPIIYGAQYHWNVPEQCHIIEGQNTAKVKVKWGNHSGHIKCKIQSKCGSFTIQKMVTVTSNLLKNPSFEENYHHWRRISEEDTKADFNIQEDFKDKNQYARIESHLINKHEWHIQLFQKNIQLIQNQAYTIRFKAKANEFGKKIRCSVIHETLYTPYAQNIIDLSEKWQEYSIQFTAPENAPISFNFDCGYDKGRFDIDDVFFGKTEAKELKNAFLSNFKVEKINTTVQLAWQDEYYKKASKYEIERSADGISYEKIVDLEPQSKDSYAATIPFMTHCEVNYFRVKRFDEYQNLSYSGIKSIKNDALNTQIKRNEKDFLKIQSNNKLKKIWLTNAVGQIFTPEIDEDNTVLLKDIPKGVYNLHLEDEAGENTLLRYVKE